MALCACPLEGQTPHPPAGTDQPTSHPASAASAAVSAKQLNDAEARFMAILANKPKDAAALSGMGLVRLQQHNYLGAISYLEQAKQTQPRNKTLADALDTARFRFFLGEGDHSLASNELTAAERRYLSALELRPDSHEAFAGLHTTLLKTRRAQQLAPALPPAAPAPSLATKPTAPAFAAQTPADAPRPDTGPANDATHTGRSVPPPMPAQGLPAQQAALQSTAGAPTSIGQPAKSTTLVGSVAAAPAPAPATRPSASISAPQPAAQATPAAQTAVAAPRPVQPASAAPAKEEVYGPFVPYVRPTPQQTKMAAVPPNSH
jgi:hypothetical protein